MTDLHLVQPEGVTLAPLSVNLPCDLHSHGRGVYPLYCEQHHVIPRDWQDEFFPEAWNPKPYQSRLLWDNRTVNCCRTGHGNIHFLLVRFMKERERLGNAMTDDNNGIHRIRLTVVEDLRSRQKVRINVMEAGWAEEAMMRWVEYGLSLMGLCGNKSYGAI
jgi:hypothetical protein